MKPKSPQEHPLWDLLKGCLRLSYAQLRWELRERGHNVSERRLSIMLRGLTQIPPEIEKVLKHIGAEGITDRILPPEEVGEVIEPWYMSDDQFDAYLSEKSVR